MSKAENKKTVFVALSGGVDSSVAALLLKKQGYYVVGVFMRCWRDESPDASVGVNCMEKDAEDARKVTEKLEIPFYVWNFEKEYKKKVVDYMVNGYKKGITPNPDVMCNKEIKFGLFLEKALKMGADYVATGHYVRLRRKSQIPNPKSQINPKSKIQNSLFTAKDKNKDQSYFLWTLNQEQLKNCFFPIGDYLKSEVRKIAKKADLPTAEKKDSQGICFLGKVKLDDFLGKYIPKKKGDIINVSGEKIGEHKGSYFYTIGQRHGLGIGGGAPYYVVEKDVKKNILKVAEGKSEALYKKEIELTNVNFITPTPLDSLIRANGRIDLLARVRYRQALIKATLKLTNSSTVQLKFDQPVKFVAPGQSAVFYNSKGEILGGGVIK
ncbi:MAG: tRNA 2-thiouridine(34) synthase MnmA [Candidatus Paceibacterota bacterium]